MLEVGMLVTVVLVLGAAAAWRLLTYRFPHPADVATISVFYYTVPLSLAAIFLGDDARIVFLHPAAADPAIEAEALSYAVTAALALEIGRWMGSKMRLWRSRIEFALVLQDADKCRVVLLILVALIALGILLYGPGAFLAGYNNGSAESSASVGTALIYLSIEWMGLVLAYGLLVKRATARGVGWPFSLLTIVVFLFLGIERGKRLEIVSALLAIGVLMFATKPFFRTRLGRLAAIFGAAVAVAALASVRFGEVPNSLSILFNLVSEGLFAGHSLPGIIERLNLGKVDYEYGKRIMAGLLAFVPGFVWSNKEEMLYSGNQALQGVSPLGATNILAEVVLQGGTLAVVLWFGVLGFFFERVHRQLADFDSAILARRLPVAIVVYLVIIVSFIPHFRDGLMPAIKIPLQSALFLLAVAGIRWLPTLTWSAVLVRCSRGAGTEDRVDSLRVGG